MPALRSTACQQTAFDCRRIERESFVRRVVLRRVLPSTNDLALRMALQPRLETPVLLLAEQQTAGRGRGGNCWWSARGALTFSLILESKPLSLAASQLPRVALTAALAVCDVVQAIVPQAGCGIRWPNDVYAAGRKICGVLPELAGQCESGPPQIRLVLGIGINVNNSLAAAPPDVRAIGVSLSDLTRERHDLTDLLLRVLGRLATRLGELATGDPGLPQAWLRCCLLTDRMIELQVGPTRVRGLCQGIDPEGALRVQVSQGVERYFGGVISFVADN